MIRPIETLKLWYSRGKFPTAAQFSDLFDSFFYKREKIPVSSVDGLTDQLNAKFNAAEAEAVRKQATDALNKATKNATEIENIYQNIEELENTADALQGDVAKVGSMLKNGATLDEAKAALLAMGTGYQNLYDLAQTLKSFLKSSDVADTTINTWKEIEHFLQGITDTDSLASMLETLENRITKAYKAAIAAAVKVEKDRAEAVEQALDLNKAGKDVATKEAAGLMSATDKQKLDDISENGIAAEKAEKDGLGRVISDTYSTKEDIENEKFLKADGSVQMNPGAILRLCTIPDKAAGGYLSFFGNEEKNTDGTLRYGISYVADNPEKGEAGAHISAYNGARLVAGSDGSRNWIKVPVAGNIQHRYPDGTIAPILDGHNFVAGVDYADPDGVAAAISALRIGGTNIYVGIYNSGSNFTISKTSTGGDSGYDMRTFSDLSAESKRNLRGKKLTVSFDYVLTNATLTGVNGFNFNVKYKDGTTTFIDANISNVFSAGTTAAGRYSKTFQIADKEIDNITSYQPILYARCTMGTVTLGRPKFEIGDKATDWSPNPYDLIYDIENIQIGGTNYVTGIKANWSGGIVNSDGTVATDNAYNIATKDYQDITPLAGKKATASVNPDDVVTSGGEHLKLAFKIAIYDTNKAFLSYISGDANAPSTFNVPANAVYCKVSVGVGMYGYVSSSFDKLRFKLERGTRATDYSLAPGDIVQSYLPRELVNTNGLYKAVRGADHLGSWLNLVRMSNNATVAQLRINVDGTLSFYNGLVGGESNIVWHAGNFNPSTKAGTDVATSSADGLMSAADKAALDGSIGMLAVTAVVTGVGSASGDKCTYTARVAAGVEISISRSNTGFIVSHNLGKECMAVVNGMGLPCFYSVSTTANSVMITTYNPANTSQKLWEPFTVSIFKYK